MRRYWTVSNEVVASETACATQMGFCGAGSIVFVILFYLYESDWLSASCGECRACALGEIDWSEFPFYFTASVVVYYFIYLPIQIWRLRRWQRKHGD